VSVFLPKPIDQELLDVAIASDDVPWVPNGQGFDFKPLHFWSSTGTWANLVRLKPGGQIRRHVHAGGQVFAYVLSGSWHYLEHDWVAKAGSWVWEPPGDVHTLEVLGDEPMVTLFVISGVIQYLDDDDQVVQQDDFRGRRHRYLEYCEEIGVEPVAIMTA
jgi:2,4'-dihydroxyacetophenone dioxygenase